MAMRYFFTSFVAKAAEHCAHTRPLEQCVLSPAGPCCMKLRTPSSVNTSRLRSRQRGSWRDLTSEYSSYRMRNFLQDTLLRCMWRTCQCQPHLRSNRDGQNVAPAIAICCSIALKIENVAASAKASCTFSAAMLSAVLSAAVSRFTAIRPYDDRYVDEATHKDLTNR